MKQAMERMKRSEKLKPELYAFFKKYVGRFDNHQEAADDLGVHKNTIPRILELKRCHTSVRIKIEQKLTA